MSMPCLSEAERVHALAALPGWTPAPDGRSIHRRFVLADFAEAFGFMTRVALAAERLGHHPDWSNAWNTVEIRLTTHEAGGLTAADIALAQAVDRAAPGVKDETGPGH